MRLILLANYYHPEEVGAAIWIRQLAVDLKRRGHDVKVLTSFPSYPKGIIFESHRGRFFDREVIDGIPVVRTMTYATASKRFWPRVANFGTFCISSALQGGWCIFQKKLKADVVYSILPPLPLGVSGWLLARIAGAKLVINIQDIYPDIAVEMGFLRNRAAIRFFRAMEHWIYRRSAKIVAISEGFRENLERKEVPTHKISVIPNWADSRSILPGTRANTFRRRLGIGDEFLILYAGGFSMNSCLEPILEAAALLPPEKFRFVFVGDGIRKSDLKAQVIEAGLLNVVFLPFQPLEQYSEVLAAADVTLVTLSSVATFASVPSKIFKQMAAARPIIGITREESELGRLIRSSGCGLIVPPDEPASLAAAVRRLADDNESCETMGLRGRQYLEAECSREQCVGRIEEALRQSCAATQSY